MNDLIEIYNQARPLPKSLQLKNKYTFAISLGIVEGKYLDINDVISKNISIKEYIKVVNAVLIFPNRVNGKIINLYIRPLDTNENTLKLGPQLLPYGIGNFLPSFKYGDPVFIVEGVGDLAAMKTINPNINIIAMLGSEVSKQQVEFLQFVSNNFILLPDADFAGTKSTKGMINTFHSYQIDLKVIKQFSTFKDPGEILDTTVLYLKNKDNQQLYNKLNLANMYYINKLKLILNKEH